MMNKLFRVRSSYNAGRTELFVLTDSEETARKICNNVMDDRFYNTWIADETEEFNCVIKLFIPNIAETRENIEMMIENRL